MSDSPEMLFSAVWSQAKKIAMHQMASPGIEILLDDRERELIVHMPDACGKDVNFKVERLTTSDASLLLPSGRVALMVERKTWYDLARSIIDRRLETQLERMVQLSDDGGSAPTRIMLLVEGEPAASDDDKIGGIRFGGLRRKLDFLSHREQLLIEYTRDVESTARRLAELGRVYARIDAHTPSQGATAGQKALKQHYTASLDETRTRMLCELPHVSRATAKVVLDRYAFATLFTDQVNENELCALQYDGGTVLGVRGTKLLCALRTSTEKKCMACKLLACVRGLTETSCSAILDAVPFCDIVGGNYERGAIAQVAHGSGRKLGTAAEDRIRTVFGTAVPVAV